MEALVGTGARRLSAERNAGIVVSRTTRQTVAELTAFVPSMAWRVPSGGMRYETAPESFADSVLVRVDPSPNPSPSPNSDPNPDPNPDPNSNPNQVLQRLDLVLGVFQKLLASRATDGHACKMLGALLGLGLG